MSSGEDFVSASPPTFSLDELDKVIRATETSTEPDPLRPLLEYLAGRVDPGRERQRAVGA
jgi:hypothetical protein